MKKPSPVFRRRCLNKNFDAYEVVLKAGEGVEVENFDENAFVYGLSGVLTSWHFELTKMFVGSWWKKVGFEVGSITAAIAGVVFLGRGIFKLEINKGTTSN